MRRVLAVALGLSLVGLGLLGLHDFLVAPSHRFLPSALGFLFFGWPGAIAAGLLLIRFGNAHSATASPDAAATERVPLLCIAIGAALLALAGIGWLWRAVAEQEAGFLGTILFFFALPPGALLLTVGAALWLYRRSRRSTS